IPVAAALILLCLAIGYAGRYIEKDTFIRWAIGVVIAGSATQIATMLFSG
ncbi:VirB2 family type IV secretion system major pilin TrwL, partial [Bartonella quintana]